MKKNILLLVSLLMFLPACSQSVVSTATPFPTDHLPTAIALTGQAALTATHAVSAIVSPTETLLPQATPIPSTALPSPTPTFAAGFTSLAQIHFLSPGPMSSVISPIKLQVLLVAGESELVQVDLLGEDGRILQRVLDHVKRDLGSSYRSFDLSFEIRAVSEKGYIRISSKDDHGRIQALNTMPVLLYSLGTNQVTLPGNMIYERVMFDGLKDGDEIHGGVLNLKGRLWPFHDGPVFMDLLLPDGNEVASRVLDFKGIDTQSFETTLPYKVTAPTLARLTVHQDNPALTISDPVLLKYIYVYTTEVMLYP